MRRYVLPNKIQQFEGKHKKIDLFKSHATDFMNEQKSVHFIVIRKTYIKSRLEEAMYIIFYELMNCAFMHESSTVVYIVHLIISVGVTTTATIMRIPNEKSLKKFVE